MSVFFRSLPILALLLLCCLSGCGREPGLDFFGIGSDTSFVQAKALLEEKGYRFEGREGEPFLFIRGDFDEYYTFADQTRLLAGLKKAFLSLTENEDGYEYFEPRFINSYIFLPQGESGGEVGVGFSALTGKPLYIYYFTDDITPELDKYHGLLAQSEQVFPPSGAADLEYHYFESGEQLLLLEKDPDGPSGGGICYFSDHVLEFYETMGKELTRYGE